MTSAERPLRADAERNRRAIIAAAATVFAQEGTAVTLERIAAAAGVGVGTVYRRFASVQDLVAVVLEEKMRAYADRTERAAADAAGQPWEAFRDYVMFLLEQQAADLAFSDVLLAPRGASDVFQAEKARAFRASVELVGRVREAGAVRAEFDHSDLLLMQHANAGLLRGTQRAAPQAWRRFGEYMLEAFRAEGGALTPPPKLWTRALRASEA
ncbi:TetR/AcrR family transcriptional regulator [Agrococcus baldri]|uniref:TetR family transcriptional regulator n=1 Tax=Agrococcus baldri TaxID=153730 RepID=A0AA87RNU5_9MICO|nr:TetR/AcrR family transcriptional regulator [Agrococcus baldri]GEK81342.1 TetR family transcriptional regulator [Agrococcus baldri]